MPKRSRAEWLLIGRKKNDLKKECQEKGLPCTGMKQDLVDRLLKYSSKPRSGQRTSENGEKRKNGDRQGPGKKPKKDPADDLMCPITHQLPWDPVTAEDGRVYEREAIEKHIKIREDKNLELQSPLTNAPMGKKLFPAPTIKSLIETLIENGAITGELADHWVKKCKEQKAKEKLLKNANSGDSKAMAKLACRYFGGSNGFELDYEESFKWAEKSEAATGLHNSTFQITSILGCLYANGLGAQKNLAKGKMYLAISVDQGSRYGAAMLGDIYYRGELASKDTKFARYWLEKCVHDKDLENDASVEVIETAKEQLEQLKASEK